MKPTNEALIRINAQKAAKEIGVYILEDGCPITEEEFLRDITLIITRQMMKPGGDEPCPKK